MKKRVEIPRAYKRNAQTKLLWLYKNNFVKFSNYCTASNKLMNR